MRQYHDLVRHILDRGIERPDRTGTGTLSVFGYQTRYDLTNADGSLGTPGVDAAPEAGFPALTTKKLHFKSIIHELLWFLRGETNARSLSEVGVSIWDEWADPETGELGPVYGSQWRSWPAPDGGTIDQIAGLERDLRDNPYGRRHLVTAWNPGDLDRMALPPCHCLFQFYVAPAAADDADDRPVLSCQLYQRSADVFLGVPFNIASYALMTMMLARVLGYRSGEFVHTMGDAHLYLNHLEQAETLLEREPRAQPVMRIGGDADSVVGYLYEDFELVGYEPHPAIRAPVAV